MKILCLHRYGRMTAAYRYRFEQYIPFIENAGIEIVNSFLFDDELLRQKYSGASSNFVSFGRSFLKRSYDLIRSHKFDGAWLYLEALPYLPGVVEQVLGLKKVPYIVDIDDAYFHKYDLSANPLVKFGLEDKFAVNLKQAHRVFAGSRYLMDYALKFNSSVDFVPTVVDTSIYSVKNSMAGGPPVIGWVGSPSTSVFLHPLIPILEGYCERHNNKFVCVGAGSLPMKKKYLDLRAWSEQDEIKNIHSFDIGIMPLSDEPFSRGKCGFKLIQYMACGLPVIASPVGANVDIVSNDVGILATTNDEWKKALALLASDYQLRKQLGNNGRQKVETEYSLSALAPRFVEGIKSIR